MGMGSSGLITQNCQAGVSRSGLESPRSSYPFRKTYLFARIRHPELISTFNLPIVNIQSGQISFVKAMHGSMKDIGIELKEVHGGARDRPRENSQARYMTGIRPEAVILSVE